MRQIEEVLADENTQPFELHDDEFENPQEMLVGFTQAGVLLEVAICYKDDQDEIFHANRVTAKYRELFAGESYE